MPNETMMRVFHVSDGTNTSSYPVRDSHINIAYGSCSTVASTAAKEATLTDDPGWKLITGSVAMIKFTYSVPANATLNIANTGAKSLYVKGAAIVADVIAAGDVVTVIYDGTKYVVTAIDRLAVDINDKLNASLKGVANGLAELGSDGKVPASQLPSYVDDVVDVASYSDLPAEGESGKIYIAVDTGKTYRWSGSTYGEVANPNPMTGATSSANGAEGLVPAPQAGDQTKYLKGDGTWATVDQADFTGATDSTGGVHGFVPAPAVGDQAKVLMGNGNWELPPNTRLDSATLNVVNQEGSYTGTVYHDAVTTHSQAIMLEIGTPEVFRDKITVTPGAGYFTVTCDDVVGSTTLKISFMRQVQTSEEITSAEFDILDNRISAIENPYTETNVTIAHTSWELVSGLYTYVWESSLVTPTCGYEVGLRDGAESAGIDDFDYEKVTGGIKFTTSQQPTGSLPVTIKLYGAKATSRDELPGCIDLPITIPANGWSNSAPYTYTYLSEYITENSAVSVDFSSANENTEISYLDSEMTSAGNGVNIIAPSKPTTAVAVVVHVDNSINANITGVNASQVATNAISGAANVQEALTSIENRLTREMALTSATKYGNVKTRLTHADKIPYLTYDYDGGNYYAPLAYKLDSFNVARFWGVRGRNSTDHFIQIDNNGLSVSVIGSDMTTTTITSECSNIVLHY